jgi:hypothetical protein
VAPAAAHPLTTAHTTYKPLWPFLQTLEPRAAQLQADLTVVTDQLAADMARLTREGAAARTEAAAASGLAHRGGAEMIDLGQRLARLEALETAESRAPLRIVSGIEGRMEGIVAQHAKYSRSVESVVSALVDDTVSLGRSSRALEAGLASQRIQLQDTREALLRSTQARQQHQH